MHTLLHSNTYIVEQCYLVNLNGWCMALAGIELLEAGEGEEEGEASLMIYFDFLLLLNFSYT